MNVKPERLEAWQVYGEKFGLGPKVPAWFEEEEAKLQFWGDDAPFVIKNCWYCGGTKQLNGQVCPECE